MIIDEIIDRILEVDSFDRDEFSWRGSPQGWRKVSASEPCIARKPGTLSAIPADGGQTELPVWGLGEIEYICTRNRWLATLCFKYQWTWGLRQFVGPLFIS